MQSIYNSHCKRYFLPTISEDGVREVIEQPAHLAGLDVGEVTTAILDDARDEIGALPLVENALFVLWQQREGNRLSGERYRRENGIAGMLRVQADALLERIDAEVPKGRQAALELLLRLTRINDEGRHSRQRITREEAVIVAGNGNDAAGELVVRLLSGERAADVPVDARSGSLRLITTSTEKKDGSEVRYVDLIHETLIRARSRDEATGKRVGYWPTLYDYIEANRDRDIHRQQLRFQTERWLRSRGPGWLWHLAYIDYGHYRNLRVAPRSDEARFLSRSRWARRALLLFGIALAAYIGESYYWTKKNELPFEAIATLQRFRLGYAPIPDFTDIPPGSFEMGEQDTEFLKATQAKHIPNFGSPKKSVEIAKGFRLGRHEVTYDHFDHYVWTQHRAGTGDLKFPTTAKGGRGNRPVVNVSWHEASAYAHWLGARTAQDCRLPTEAEWEHAARANTTSAYPWGDEVRRSNHGKHEVMANCDGCGSPWDKQQSAPVGCFPPNEFGLYDTSGNVWEWTCSLWREQFDGSETQCAKADDAGTRVVRGGSWLNVAGLARSAARYDRYPDNRDVGIGFRVLCSSSIE